MSIAKIFEKRTVGKIRLGFSRCVSINDLLSTFGFAEKDNSSLIEVNRQTAVDILTTLLLNDMAYGMDLMESTEANSIAIDFLSLFPGGGCRYFTNGLWDQYRNSGVFSFVPLTKSTFDGGIMVLSDNISGCIWFEDED